ncbi:unnamed protein product, partial [Nesidiocoris tenuis]
MIKNNNFFCIPFWFYIFKSDQKLFSYRNAENSADKKSEGFGNERSRKAGGAENCETFNFPWQTAEC